MLKRLRGLVLRAALRRRRALAAGAALAAVAALPAIAGWDSPVGDALALVAGATGVALLLAGLAGRRPDWIEEPRGPAGSAAARGAEEDQARRV